VESLVKGQLACVKERALHGKERVNLLKEEVRL
jgi:hypothetical protein